MNTPIRAAAIVIKTDKVLLIWRKNQGKEYYVFPGGKVEVAEKIEEAVVREVKEESTLEIRVAWLLYHHHYTNESDQYFYLCDYVSGEPRLGEGNEKEAMRENIEDFYQPLWVDVDKMKNLLIYPLEIRDWLLADMQDNFKHCPREAMLEINHLRQSL